MKALLFFCILLFTGLFGLAQNVEYKSLDTNCKIDFEGDFIRFQGERIELGPKAFFIDGQFSDAVCNAFPYVFNSVNKAVEHLTNGSESEPMVLYIAPWVYWIDNPDDPEVRKAFNGVTPYGLEIECDWLKFYGLTNDPKKVVLACNRGQTIGALGNFTMFRIDGTGTASENITFGNYCNVDLDFPLKPELSREKRAKAIVQAQLIHCNGDKIVARNTRFISRLNLCPFVGGKRVLFENCHFESTDDALCGTAVYLNCTLDFYSSKPFYNTFGTGAVFLNCDIHSMAGGEQYFTKANGQLAVIDTRINSDNDVYIAWNDVTPPQTRNYQSGVTLNGESYLIGEKDSQSTIDISNKNALRAFKISAGDSAFYNVYNLLSGNDDWDPLNQKDQISTLEKDDNEAYSGIPVQMRLSPANAVAETGKDTINLEAKLYRFGNFEATDSTIKWKVDNEFDEFVQLIPAADGASCLVIPTNNTNHKVQVVVEAQTASGLEAASLILVAPGKLPAPEFKVLPTLSLEQTGELKLNYQLNTDFEDQSMVNWYRCKDKNGNNPIKVAVSRGNRPLNVYSLNSGDEGYYMMAEVLPRHIRSDYGKTKQVVSNEPVNKTDILENDFHLMTDFKHVAVNNQLKVLPGFWTFRPLGTERNGIVVPVDSTKDAWFYGKGSQGNANMEGLLQTDRSGTMLYTTVMPEVGNMKMKMTVSPFKTAGQGFAIAPLYMDVLIKFDTKTMTGYGLRFQRTTKYGNAVDCYFVQYDHEKVTPLGESVSTSCFRSPCFIELTVNGNEIKALVSTTTDYSNPEFPEILPNVNISAPIRSNKFGGFGIQYNGGSTTMINSIEVFWDE